MGRSCASFQPIRSAGWDGQRLEFVLHDVTALGFVGAELVIALGDGAEWPLAVMRASAHGVQVPRLRSSHLALTIHWRVAGLALAWFPMAVAVATGIAVARLTALTADFELLSAAGGAVSVCWLSHRNLPSKNEGSYRGTTGPGGGRCLRHTRTSRGRHAAPFVPSSDTEGQDHPPPTSLKHSHPTPRAKASGNFDRSGSTRWSDVVR